jgi:hypothetical protein
MILMFAPAWVHVVSLCSLSIFLGTVGVGFFLGPHVDLMVIGGLLQAAKLSAYVFLLRTPEVSLPVRIYFALFISAETLFVAASMFGVVFTATANPHMPPGLEDCGAWLQWGFTTVLVAGDAMCMLMLPAPLNTLSDARKRYA